MKDNYCSECYHEMKEVKRWWGEEAYYGIYEHILYECDCGHQHEAKHDVPVELLPFMPPEDDEKDYAEW